MATLTKEQEATLSGALEDIYAELVDKILKNMSNHMWETAPSTTIYELKRMAELDGFTAETAKQIREYTKNAPNEVKKAVEQAINYSTKDVEEELSEAADNGDLVKPYSDVMSSNRMQEYMSSLLRQADDQLNLVNTTMLQSSIDTYSSTVRNIVAELNAQQADAAQSSLNSAVVGVRSGVSIFTQVVSQAVKEMAENGITGFTDKSGRNWTPEAYVSMDIRTTVHNASINSTKIRQEEYGTDIFMCSAHPASRPSHYDYQNKFYSWNNRSGIFKDGKGNEHSFEPVSVTGYGSAGGLFGINCHHSPKVVIPNVTIPHDTEVETKKQNDKNYSNQQTQRNLERNIRQAKRELSVQQKGTPEYTEASAKVRSAQADMRSFISETGLKRQSSREQIYGGK